MCVIVTYEVITVVVTFLTSHANLNLIVSGVACGLQEVLGKELSLLVEVVSSALRPPPSGEFC